MKNLAHTEIYKGKKIDIFYDQDAESPDTWGNDEYFLVYDHRDFYVKRKGYDPEEINEETKGGETLYCGMYVFPIYAYIHSDVRLSLGRSGYPFSCPWDTSLRGFALVKRQKGAWAREQARKQASGLIEEWNDYLSGQVYGYSTENDGCSGYYGDEGMKEAIQQARDSIDAEVRQTIQEHCKQLRRWIGARVPLVYRKPLNIATA